MPRFLHTADWQIGKPYRSIQDTQKRFRTQYERVQAIKRVAEIADKENVDALLVAGDLFDSSTVETELVMEKEFMMRF